MKHQTPQNCEINSAHAAVASAVIGVIYNPLSHRNKGQDLENVSHPNITIVQPRKRGDIVEALTNFKAKGVNYLIINGGDGTVRDVLTRGHSIFGNEWPEIAVLPKGKTNALNVDLGAPNDWSLCAAIEGYATARRIIRRPMVVTQHSTDDDSKVWKGAKLGFILGLGGYRHGVHAGQGAHKLGAFNGLAVTLASAWGLFQAVFGRNSNPWRRGVEMTLKLLPSGEELPHSGGGYEGRRSLLLASTLNRFPAGLKLFGNLGAGLKITVMDYPRRLILAAMPGILYGFGPRDLLPYGVHQVQADGFEMTTGDPFILDGEEYAAGVYSISEGPDLAFVVP